MPPTPPRRSNRLSELETMPTDSNSRLQTPEKANNRKISPELPLKRTRTERDDKQHDDDFYSDSGSEYGDNEHEKKQECDSESERGSESEADESDKDVPIPAKGNLTLCEDDRISRNNASRDTIRARKYIKVYYHDVTNRTMFFNTLSKNLFAYERHAIDEVLDCSTTGIGRIASSSAPSSKIFPVKKNSKGNFVIKKRQKRRKTSSDIVSDTSTTESSHLSSIVARIQKDAFELGYNALKDIDCADIDIDTITRMAISNIKFGIELGYNHGN